MEMETPQCDPGQQDDLEHTLATLGRKTIRIEHLEADNASLRAQLSASLSQADAVPGNGTMLGSPAPSSQSTSSTKTVPAAEHEALKLQFAKLLASHTALTGQYEIIRKKYKESKALMKQWQAYLKEKREREGKARDSDPTSTPPPPEAVEQRTGRSPVDMDVTPRASTIAIELVPVSLDCRQHGPPEMTSSPPRRAAGPGQSTALPEPQMHSQHGGATTSSQTTVDDPETQGAPPLPIQPAPSSDFEPIVVSTRCLKRKAGADGDPRLPTRRIKQEHSSPNTPILPWSVGSRPPQDLRTDTTSSDDCLDNFGPAMRTPRRPKRVSDLRLRATSEEVPRFAPQLRRSASSLSDGDVGALFEPLSSLVTVNNHGAQENESHPGQSNRSPDLQASVRQHGDALRPISGNVPRHQRTLEAQGKPRAKIRRTGVKDRILLVSEDGDDGSSQRAARVEGQQNVSSPGMAMDERLDDLLNGPSLNRTPIMPHLISPAGVSPQHQTRPRSGQLRTPVSVVKRKSPVKPTTSLGRTPVRVDSPKSGKPTSAVDRGDDRGKSPPVVRPEEEPLRIRPAASLRLEDFKINPSYMGTDFAFADTIRGRDARQNLHACTREDCCGGALEKVIRMGGTAMSGRTDAHALEAFIGPAWQALMGAKKPDEAKRLLLQAHAFCFANEHGKHRQAFERRSTPPGYWRADFPTTQEQATDRQTAEEMKRKEVEDRHREAMREGGRWMFRDE